MKNFIFLQNMILKPNRSYCKIPENLQLVKMSKYEFLKNKLFKIGEENTAFIGSGKVLKSIT